MKAQSDSHGLKIPWLRVASVNGRGVVSPSMYRSILFPTDGSRQAKRALEHAIDLAGTYDATLHIISVVDTRVGADASFVDVYASLEDSAQRWVSEALDAAEAAGLDDIEGETVQGPPHEGILEFADDRDVDLIVMGTHGRSGLDRYLLGSVTEKVVRLADVPVLTVRVSEEEDS